MVNYFTKEQIKSQVPRYIRLLRMYRLGVTVTIDEDEIAFFKHCTSFFKPVHVAELRDFYSDDSVAWFDKKGRAIIVIKDNYIRANKRFLSSVENQPFFKKFRQLMLENEFLRELTKLELSKYLSFRFAFENTGCVYFTNIEKKFKKTSKK